MVFGHESLRDFKEARLGLGLNFAGRNSFGVRSRL